MLNHTNAKAVFARISNTTSIHVKMGTVFAPLRSHVHTHEHRLRTNAEIRFGTLALSLVSRAEQGGSCDVPVSGRKVCPV